MESTPTSRDTKREMLRMLLCDGQQPCKIVVDPRQFGGEDTGFPERVVATYPEGIPLDLDPAWPLDLDLDSDPGTLALNLSFSSSVWRCHIPWSAVAMIAAGMGSAAWAHESGDETPLPPPTSKPGARVGHLRVLK
jgi:hypothetical protein